MPVIKNRGFTLVELLVVIAIIVILLALLVGGLEKALKAAERSKCGANQRSIAQGCAAYALEYERTFPVAKTIPLGTAASNSLAIRLASGDATNAPLTEAQGAALAVGFGHLIASGRVGGTTKGGEVAHCPSLDTTSGNPVKYGMDEATYTAEDNPTVVVPPPSPDPTIPGLPSLPVPNPSAPQAAGASYWTDAASGNKKIMGGYHYRGLSYQNTRSGGTIRTNIAKATFVITADTLSMTRSDSTPVNRWGRMFHHIDGWNVSYGDGHVSYVKDEEGPIRADGTGSNGFVETKVVGNNTQYPGPGGFPNDAPFATINGVTKPGADEAVFAYLGKR